MSCQGSTLPLLYLCQVSEEATKALEQAQMRIDELHLKKLQEDPDGFFRDESCDRIDELHLDVRGRKLGSMVRINRL